MPTIKASKTKRVKGGKGKKNGKRVSKPERETDVETARANAALWELKLKVTDQDLAECREAHFSLACLNERLTNKLHRSEEDSMDMSRYWQRKEEEHEQEVRNLMEDMKRQEELALNEKNKMAQDIRMIQDKVKDLKEIKAQLEQELSDVRRQKTNQTSSVENLKREVEKRSNLEIAKLKLDHHESVVRLENAFRSASKENHRLSEMLKNTTKEAEDLKKLTHSLSEKNTTLALEKDMLDLTVRKNRAEMEALKKKLSELKARSASLEQTVVQTVVKLEHQEKKERMNLVTIQASQVELDKLQNVLLMRENEIKHVKQLAGTIVTRRREVERFFHEALDHVREEIVSSRLQYKKEALQDYQWKLKEATAGKIKFPPIRTFNNNPNSTNSVYTSKEEAVKWPCPQGSEVQISDLSWEQKEQVLMLLFAKMNGQTERKSVQHLVRPLRSRRTAADTDTAEKNAPE
ncbi:basal body-orientation factor 1 isoform X2 [Nothobranchius furzeri]|uniref:basal body-orientation factor 1 isoform X2 n=1 Tax=Nothobranchius furzeri TaxID=105023 RepID=UPI003904C2A1